MTLLHLLPFFSDISAMANKKKTRNSSGDPEKAVGGAADLPQAELPLLKEIFARARQIKESSFKQMTVTKDLIDTLYGEVLALYLKVNSNLPLITERMGKEKLKALYEKYKDLVRSGASATSPRMIAFQDKLDRIFDLVACKCEIKECGDVSCEGCEVKAHISCSCKKDKKIPVNELHFVLDQRRRVGVKGLVQLGNKDLPEMSRMDRNMLKKSNSKHSQSITEEVQREELFVEDQFVKATMTMPYQNELKEEQM